METAICVIPSHCIHVAEEVINPRILCFYTSFPPSQSSERMRRKVQLNTT